MKIMTIQYIYIVSTVLGHVLRLPENSPAVPVSLTFSLDGCSAKSRRGRHQTNLINTIKSDLKIRGFHLECLEDILETLLRRGQFGRNFLTFR